MYHLCVDHRKLFTWLRLSVIKFLFVYVQISLATGLRERYVRSCRFYDRYYKMRRIISPSEDNNCPCFTRRWGNRPKYMLNVDLTNWISKSGVKCSVLCPIHNIQMELQCSVSCTQRTDGNICSCEILSLSLCCYRRLKVRDKANRILWNVRKYLPVDTAKQPRGLESLHLFLSL
jgi:hypothetical protein